MDSGIAIAAGSRHSEGAVGAAVAGQHNMRPFFKDITIEREFESGTRSETHEIGVVGGVLPVPGSDGRTSGPNQHHAVRWDSNALVFESGTYTGQSAETGVWTERREVWSLDSNDRLHLMITTRSSVDALRTVALVYRRLEDGSDLYPPVDLVATRSNRRSQPAAGW